VNEMKEMKKLIPAAWKKLKKAIKHKNGSFGVYLTPEGTSKHIRVGTMDDKLSVCVFEKSSKVLVPVERAALEMRTAIDEQRCYIDMEESDAYRAIQFYDVLVGNDEKVEKRWMDKLPQGFARISANLRRIMGNPPRTNRETELENELASVRRELRRTRDLLNKDAGAVIELQIAGLIPMSEKPPIPLRNIHQIHYGCDWLSMAWKDNFLHRFWIESNLSRTGTRPSFTQNEGRMMKAGGEGRVVDHYVHHWVDQDGKMHWEIIEKRRS
jgi:hypothetical protein